MAPGMQRSLSTLEHIVLNVTELERQLAGLSIFITRIAVALSLVSALLYVPPLCWDRLHNTCIHSAPTRSGGSNDVQRNSFWWYIPLSTCGIEFAPSLYWAVLSASCPGRGGIFMALGTLGEGLALDHL